MNPKTIPLAAALKALGEHGDRLAIFEPAPEDLTKLTADLKTVHKLLAAVRAEQGPACRRHPNVPGDPVAGGDCLLCVQHERRGQSAAPVQAGGLPYAEICRHIAEHGPDEAIAQYGPAAVARAINRCRNAPEPEGEAR